MGKILPNCKKFCQREAVKYMFKKTIFIVSFLAIFSCFFGVNVFPVQALTAEEPAVEAGEEEAQFEGYIVEYKEKPLMTRWQELGGEEMTGTSAAFYNMFRTMAEIGSEINKLYLNTVVSSLNTKTREEFKSTFNGISLDISLEEAEEVEKLSFVKNVTPNYEVYALLTESVPLINADDVWNLGYTGKGKTIAIIDTGIDYTHPDLGGCFGTGCKVVGGFDFVSGDSDPMDDHGHGTHCAGIAAGSGALKGVAPDAKLLAYKVLSAGGSGSFDQVIAGVERAVDPNNDGDYSDHADVISMSLGANMSSDGTDPLSIAVDNAVEQGVVAVVAAGNSGSKYFTVGSPGGSQKAITVGATDKNDQIASFSSRGPTTDGRVKPDVVAPGVYITSAIPKEGAAYSDPSGYKTWSGTSMSTPHVAGAATLILDANPSMPLGWSAPKFVKNSLISTAVDVGYNVYTQGGGRIDVAQAIDPKILIDPATVSLVTATEPITFTFYNLDKTEHVLNLKASLADYQGANLSGKVSLAPS
ncbi:MAG: S8 family serine peptidase, partial [Patescibacteria group bacterium]